MAPIDMALKTRENLLRRMAVRQGLRLAKNQRRDPRALGFGTWALVRCPEFGPACTVPAAYRDHWATHELVHGDPRTGFGLSLDQVEAWLTDDDRAHSVHSHRESEDSGIGGDTTN